MTIGHHGIILLQDQAAATGDGGQGGAGGVVGFEDVLLLFAAWGECAGCPEDFNGDGFADEEDLTLLLANSTG